MTAKLYLARRERAIALFTHYPVLNVKVNQGNHPNPVNPESDHNNNNTNPNLTGKTAQERFFAGEFGVKLAPLHPCPQAGGEDAGLDTIFPNGMVGLVRVRVRVTTHTHHSPSITHPNPTTNRRVRFTNELG